MVEKRGPRKISGPKSEDVKGDWGKLLSKEFNE
jgi:hypothetical protein